VFVMIVFPQIKWLNDHDVTFRVDLESAEEVHAFVSSYRPKYSARRHSCVSVW